jgi:short chain dehydrogenase
MERSVTTPFIDQLQWTVSFNVSIHRAADSFNQQAPWIRVCIRWLVKPRAKLGLVFYWRCFGGYIRKLAYYRWMKSVFITGASSGIGAALARQYATQGATVGLVARRADLLEQLRQSLPDPHKHKIYPLDVNDQGCQRGDCQCWHGAQQTYRRA